MILAVICGVIGALLMWPVASHGAANLGESGAKSVELSLVAVAAVCGMLAGHLISRKRNRGNHVAFGATVGGVCASIAGAAFAIVMGIAYLRTFGGSTTGTFDTLLVILSFPVFAALGGLVAMVPGIILGACVSAIMGRISGPGR